MNLLGIFGITLAAYAMGLIMAKIKLPSILGWLVTGIIFGPHLMGFVTFDTMESSTYIFILAVAEFLVGGYFVSQMKPKDKNAPVVFDPTALTGKSILIITLLESASTYIIVSAVFAVVFAISDIPVFLAFIFGGIALATAPAPSISIVQQYKTKGPVTKALVPVALIDDGVAFVFFFGTLTIVTTMLGAATDKVELTLSLIIGKVLPFILSGGLAFLTIALYKKIKNNITATVVSIVMLLLTIATCITSDIILLGSIQSQFLLVGLIYMVLLIQLVDPDKLALFKKTMGTAFEIGMILLILDLGMPLDYSLIASAGLFTAIYIIARAVGKISGAAIGAKLVKAEPVVCKYLGLTLLPHSGVSLIFTGLAVTALLPIAPEVVPILQGTIAAAAVINEVFAVILANQAFKWAGEMPKEDVVTTTTSV